MKTHRFIHIVVLGLSVVFAAQAFAQLQPLPNQRDTATIVEVRIIGNEHIDTETILTQIRTAKGQPYSVSQINADKSALIAMGLFAAVDVEAASTSLGMVVTFKVVENDVVKEIIIQGNKAVPTADILKVMRTKSSQVLNTRIIEEDAQAISKLYSERGYIVFPDLGAEIDKDGRLILTLLEAVIEDITLTFIGKNDKPTDKHETKPQVIWRAIQTKKGDVFNARKLGEDMNILFTTNIFEDVRYETKSGSEPGKIKVDVQVKERRTGQALVGLGVSTRGGLIGFADISKLNLQGMNRQLGGRAEFGDRRSFEIRFVEPWLDSKQTSLSVSVGDRLIFREPRSVVAFTNNVEESFFDERRKGVRLTLARPLRNRTTSVFATVRAEDVSLERTDLNTFVRDLQSFGRVSALRVGLIKDTRSNKFHPALGTMDPTNGGYVLLGLEGAASLLGGDSSFRKIDLELRRFRPVGKRTTLAGRLLVGRAFGSLPAFEQFFVGGSESLRGYNIDHEFGDNQVILNLEARYNLKANRDPRQGLQLVLFMDWGDAWGGNFSNGGGFSPLFGFGFGFRMGTPIGPIRLDIGFGKEGAKTHFSIGPLF